MHHTVHKHQLSFKDFTRSVHKKSAQKTKIKIKIEKQLLNDLSQKTEQTHITLLEVLRTSKIQYLPKNVFYGTEKTIA